jgi:hypothetical protein
MLATCRNMGANIGPTIYFMRNHADIFLAMQSSEQMKFFALHWNDVVLVRSPLLMKFVILLCEIAQ